MSSFREQLYLQQWWGTLILSALEVTLDKVIPFAKGSFAVILEEVFPFTWCDERNEFNCILTSVSVFLLLQIISSES